VRKEPVFASGASIALEDERAAGLDRKDYVAILCALLAAAAIVINALYLQSGPHPNPIFPNRRPPEATKSPVVAPQVSQKEQVAVAMPRPRPLEPEAAKAEPAAPARPAREVVADIQKELSRRGFYEGIADGVYGAKTDVAIRDFEQAAGVRIGHEPNEAMLRAISRSGVKAAAAPAQARDVPRPPDPIAEILVPPARRVIAVQRVLAEFGYGQIKPNGNFDRETQDAIEQFERARKLPVTRQITPTLLRELAALSGRPLE